MADPFRIAIVPGVSPGKWVRTWERRFPDDPIEVEVVDVVDQTAVLREGRADMSFVRLPADREGLHLIPLYVEVAVVVVPRGHWVDGLDEVTLADLAPEHLWPVATPGMTTRQTIETVAAGTGVVVLPMSVARLHHRKDVVAVPVSDGPESPVGLAWPVDVADPRIEDFVGIVRGRTERSSRGTEPAAPEKARGAAKPVKKAGVRGGRKPAPKSGRRPRRRT